MQSLSQYALANSVGQLLTNEGSFWLLYPEREAHAFRKEAANAGLFLNKQIIIYNHPTSMVFRVVQEFSFEDKEVVSSELIIKDEEGSYTDTFVKLLAPYYLHL